MTAVKFVSLWCDTDQCARLIDTPELHTTAAREFARGIGWTSRRAVTGASTTTTIDLCPSHSVAS